MKYLLILAMFIGVQAQTFDVALYDKILQTYVDEEGFVDYAGIKKNEIKNIETLAKQLAEMSPNSHPDKFQTREAQMAYWFNAYNLLIVKKIVDNYPTESIKDIYWPGARVWIVDHEVGKEELSFNNIEHDIIRPTFKDARIHYAVNCASYGCPKLQNRAFTPENVEALMNKGLKEFFESERNYKVDKDNKTIYLSAILDWFKEDFYDEDKDETVKDYLINKAPKHVADFVKANPDYEIDYIEYDWNLNEQK